MKKTLFVLIVMFCFTVQVSYSQSPLDPSGPVAPSADVEIPEIPEPVLEDFALPPPSVFDEVLEVLEADEAVGDIG